MSSRSRTLAIAALLAAVVGLPLIVAVPDGTAQVKPAVGQPKFQHANIHVHFVSTKKGLAKRPTIEQLALAKPFLPAAVKPELAKSSHAAALHVPARLKVEE